MKALATRTDWALGIEARSRALLSDGDRAERMFREADRASRSNPGARGAGPRSSALRRVAAARESPGATHAPSSSAAHDHVHCDGHSGLRRTRPRELLATGETARKRTVETRDDLTAQERQIAQLARDGLSNPEIGARLFLSPRTVEWHLHHVFTKLGIRSRGQLARALPAADTEAPAT